MDLEISAFVSSKDQNCMANDFFSKMVFSTKTKNSELNPTTFMVETRKVVALKKFQRPLTPEKT